MERSIVEPAEYWAGDQLCVCEDIGLCEIRQESCKVRVFAVIAPAPLAIARDEVKRRRSLEEFLRTPQSTPSVRGRICENIFRGRIAVYRVVYPGEAATPFQSLPRIARIGDVFVPVCRPL